jgi:bacillithiol biosynthesis deacetylase BshB1
MKLDILAVGVHPDDVELGCSGTLMKHIDLGYKAGILDLTKGELGTRGNVKTRMKEVGVATKLMKLHVRQSLNFADGFFTNDKKHQLEVIKIIRHYRPTIVFANAIHDRHPDHARSATLVRDACFLAGLPKVQTTYKGVKQQAFRPKAVYHYIQALHVEPDFVIDITDYFERKMEVIKAFKSQFFDPNSKEPNTFISSPQFLEFVRSRAIHFGVPSGMQYAEAFTTNRTLGVEDVTKLL